MMILKWIKSLRNFVGRTQVYVHIAFKKGAFTYNACVVFTKHCWRIQIFMKTGNSKDTYKNKLDKGCFTHHAAAYFDGKDLA